MGVWCKNLVLNIGDCVSCLWYRENFFLKYEQILTQDDHVKAQYKLIFTQNSLKNLKNSVGHLFTQNLAYLFEIE